MARLATDGVREAPPPPGDVDAGVRWTVQHATAGSTWWREHFRRAGVDAASISGVADPPRLPFSTKADLRATYPLGWASVPDSELIRIHASSGTTGKRTVCAYTRGDVEDWTEQFARCFAMAGVTPTDRVQVMVGYGLWTAGAGVPGGGGAARRDGRPYRARQPRPAARDDARPAVDRPVRDLLVRAPHR